MSAAYRAALAATACVAVAAGATGNAPLASAQVQARIAYVPETGPVLTGSSVAWAERHRDGSVSVREVPERTSQVRTVRRFATSGGSRVNVALAGSKAWLGVEVDRTFSTEDPAIPGRVQRSFGRSLGGTLRQLSLECSRDLGDFGVRSIDAYADVLAFRGPNCREGSRMTADGRLEATYPDGAFGLRTAGRFAAWFEGPSSEGRYSVVVRRVDTQHEVLRVASKAFTGPTRDLAVDVDGTVAVLLTDTRGPKVSGLPVEGLAVVSPSEPRPRLLRRHVASSAPVQLLGRRILVLLSERGKPQRLAVLDAKTGRILASGTGVNVEPAFSVDFDSDGDRVASVVRQCHRVAITVTELPPRPVVRNRRCRLRLADRPLLSGRHLRLRVSCRGFTQACQVRVKLRIAGQPVARGLSGPGGHVAVRLNGRERRLLRRRPRLRIDAAYGQYDEEARALHGVVSRRGIFGVRTRDEHELSRISPQGIRRRPDSR